MTKKSKCLNCGQVFPSQTLKKKHKKEYPDGSCAKAFQCSKENKDAIELIDKKLENMHKYAGSKGILLEIKKELMNPNAEKDSRCNCPRCQISRAKIKIYKENERRNNMEEEKVIDNSRKPRQSPIQKVATILVPQEQAKVEWKKYCDLLNQRKNKHDKHLKVLKKAMYFAKQGKKFIDVYEVMKKAGVSKKNEPRLAVARADIHEVRFEKGDTGTGSFLMGSDEWRDQVNLPQNVFKIQWERDVEDGKEISWRIKDKRLKTKVPIIPADLMPDGDLKNYYVLWEVKEWEQLPESKDPFLLKRISENLFVILGSWDITPLERAIIGGLK